MPLSLLSRAAQLDLAAHRDAHPFPRRSVGSAQGDADMTEAYWNGVRIAASDDIVTVEGNAYFPRAAVDPAVLVDSATTSVCPWKGTAHYHTLRVDGAENRDAAWYYPEPKVAAKEITDRIAFWKGVEVR
jgi:uncharacterized protein (DUF427 family)